MVLSSCAGPDLLRLHGLCLLFLPRWICVRSCLSMCYSITELTDRGVCFPLTGQTRRGTQASFTAERPKGPVVIRQKLCSCSEESLSFNVFIGTSLSPFLLSSKHEKPWLVLSFSCVLLKYFSKTLKSTSSGRFAIFIPLSV